MRAFATILLMIVTIGCNVGVNAQSTTRTKYPRYDEFISNHLSTALNLEGSRKERFEELYIKFLDETEAARKSKTGKYDLSDLSILSDEQIESQIVSTYALTIDIIKIKRRYYGIFKEILTPREIATMYDLERVGRSIFAAELKKRKEERKLRQK